LVVFLVGLNNRQRGKLEHPTKPKTCALGDLEAATDHTNKTTGLELVVNIVERAQVARFGNWLRLGAQADPYAAARNRTQTKLLYRQLDERLSTREWIGGDDYSIADIAIYPWSLYLEQHGFDPAAHTSLIRWRDLIRAREPVKRSWERFAAAFDEESHETGRAATPAQLDAFFNRDPDVPAVDYSSVTTR
jgi:hypothetical protein